MSISSLAQLPSDPRSHEVGLLVDLLRLSPITVLHAEAGADKSNVIRSAVLPLLEERASRARTELAVLFDAWHEAPLAALIAQIAQAVQARKKDGVPDAGACPTLRAIIGSWEKTLDVGFIIIFDRFEEYLALADSPEIREFEDQFVAAVNDHRLRSHFLLSLDEDAAPLLGRLRERIPGLGDARVRLPRAALAGTGEVRRGAELDLHAQRRRPQSREPATPLFFGSEPGSARSEQRKISAEEQTAATETATLRVDSGEASPKLQGTAAGSGRSEQQQVPRTETLAERLERMRAEYDVRTQGTRTNIAPAAAPNTIESSSAARAATGTKGAPVSLVVPNDPDARTKFQPKHENGSDAKALTGLAVAPRRAPVRTGALASAGLQPHEWHRADSKPTEALSSSTPVSTPGSSDGLASTQQEREHFRDANSKPPEAMSSAPVFTPVSNDGLATTDQQREYFRDGNSKPSEAVSSAPVLTPVSNEGLATTDRQHEHFRDGKPKLTEAVSSAPVFAPVSNDGFASTRQYRQHLGDADLKAGAQGAAMPPDTRVYKRFPVSRGAWLAIAMGLLVLSYWIIERPHYTPEAASDAARSATVSPAARDAESPRAAAANNQPAPLPGEGGPLRSERDYFTSQDWLGQQGTGTAPLHMVPVPQQARAPEHPPQPSARIAPPAPTRAKSEPRRSSRSATASVSASSPMLYIHVRNEAQRLRAERMIQPLAKRGIRVSGIKLVKFGPSVADLRYFRTGERDDALKIAIALRELGVNAQRLHQVSDLEGRAPRGQLELWLAPGRT